MERDLSHLIPESLKGILVSTPDTLSGAIRFAGTRIPVEVLIHNLQDGMSLEEIVESYPGLPLEGAMRVIAYEHAKFLESLGLAS